MFGKVTTKSLKRLASLCASQEFTHPGRWECRFLHTYEVPVAVCCCWGVLLQEACRRCWCAAP